MMRRWLAVVVLTWTAQWSEPTVCPCAQPKENPYTGRLEPSQSICATACFENHTKKMVREFGDSVEAKTFQHGCSPCAYQEIPFPNPCCQDWTTETK